jgi:hypothetical protein
MPRADTLNSSGNILQQRRADNREDWYHESKHRGQPGSTAAAKRELGQPMLMRAVTPTAWRRSSVAEQRTERTDTCSSEQTSWNSLGERTSCSKQSKTERTDMLKRRHPAQLWSERTCAVEGRGNQENSQRLMRADTLHNPEALQGSAEQKNREN